MRSLVGYFLLTLPALWVSLIHGPRAGVAFAALLVVGATAWVGSSFLTGPEGFRGRRLHPLAWLLSRPAVVDWLIRRAMRTPYIHIDGYMNRWWLFNPYDPETRQVRWRWLPSVRIHHILREDRDSHMHDHPWDARTVILRGWYLEAKERPQIPAAGFQSYDAWLHARNTPAWRYMMPGDTAPVLFNEFHRIAQVSDGGVFTLFITGPYLGEWGFKVDGKKVPHKCYLKGHKWQPHESGSSCARCGVELPQ